MDDMWRVVAGAVVALAIIGLLLFAAGTAAHQRSEGEAPAVARIAGGVA